MILIYIVSQNLLYVSTNSIIWHFFPVSTEADRYKDSSSKGLLRFQNESFFAASWKTKGRLSSGKYLDLLVGINRV